MELAIAIAATFLATILGWWLNRRFPSRTISDSQIGKGTPELELLQPVSEPPDSGPLEIREQPKYKIVKGYLPHWHEGPGSYEAQRDFLYLEYECKLESPEQVMIQVEGPIEDVQPEWNARKVLLAGRVQELYQELSRDLPWPNQRGRKSGLANVKRYRATTVFKVIVSDLDSQADSTTRSREAIQSVHEQIGLRLDHAWFAS